MNRRKAIFTIGAISSWLALGAQLNAAGKTEIKIGYLPISDHLLIIAKDIFKDDKFSLKAIKFASWADISEALRARAIDGAFLLAPLGLNLRANGLDIKAVLSAHKNGSNLVAKKEIKSIAELKGKKLGIPSRFSTHFYLAKKLLKKHKIENEVEYIDIAPTEMPFALLNGKIDAYIVAEPFAEFSIKKGVAHSLIHSKDIQNNHICCVLNLYSDILKQSYYNKLIDSFKNAAILAQDSNKNAELAAKALGQNKDILKSVLDNKIVSYNDLSLKISDLEQLREFLVQNNLASDKLKALNLNDYLSVNL